MAIAIAFAVVALAVIGWGLIGLAQAAGKQPPPMTVEDQGDDVEHPFSVLAAATVKRWDDADELESEQHLAIANRDVWHAGPRAGCVLCVADSRTGINPS